MNSRLARHEKARVSQKFPATIVLLQLLLLTACGGSGGSSTPPPAEASSAALASSTSSAIAPSSTAVSSSPAAVSSTTSETAASSISSASSSALSSSSAAAKIPAPDLSADPSLPLKGSPTYFAAAEAVRFLAQTTFGATAKDIERVMNLGKSAWLDEQFAKPQTYHLQLLEARFEAIGLVAIPEQDLNTEGYLRELQRSDIWWEVALWGDDQLRQRVAYSLSQILVISGVSDALFNDSRGIANYQDLLATHAFGNYRDLLTAVTLNPMMGEYLSMVRNEKADSTRNIRPDENYARELMQLFTIGLVQLNLDGSVKLDAQNNPLPTYDQTTVKELARVFTGWNMATITQWWEWTQSGASETLPMKAFDNYHDFGAKTLFGDHTIAANKTPAADIEAALDIIFAHDNIAPFISKQLIQRLVTSNPSPAYVERVARIFNDNGQGVKGDMKAVITAIVLDTEAQQGHTTAPETFGKLREPILKMSHLWRAFKGTGMRTRLESGAITAPRIRFLHTDSVLGQRPFGSLSVFNFYRPDYQHSGAIKNANLLAPEFQILTESMIMASASTLSNAIFWRDTEHEWLEPIIEGYWGMYSPRLHLQSERELTANPAALLERLNLLLMAGQMSQPMYDLLLAHLNDNRVNPDWDAAGQMWQRDTMVYEALFLVMASPEYAVQR